MNINRNFHHFNCSHSQPKQCISLKKFPSGDHNISTVSIRSLTKVLHSQNWHLSTQAESDKFYRSLGQSLNHAPPDVCFQTSFLRKLFFLQPIISIKELLQLLTGSNLNGNTQQPSIKHLSLPTSDQSIWTVDSVLYTVYYCYSC